MAPKIDFQKNPESSDVTPSKIPSSPNELEVLYDSLMDASIDQEIYSYPTREPHSFKLLLSNLPSDTAKEFGFDTSILLTSSKNNITRMQMNMGGTDSVSGLRQGGPRLWLFVSSECNEKLEKIASEKLQEVKAREWLCLCTTPLMHREWAINPKILREWGIKFEIVPQYPGDVIYVPIFTYYQIIDVDNNVSESVIIGSIRWLKNASRFKICDCEDELVESLDIRPYEDLLRKNLLKSRMNSKKGSTRGRRK
ncbi:hypothetical protein QAD02_016734 [Eretmocerus hayati]|uniref:Uncharacterized protein n=1 Tax=Eretmocerus hayati TaxID=131215 RepID=A0ACC2PCB4_9HYME|nr:hypothetical protein QAD02_016734 [Eretmocerus hayati]